MPEASELIAAAWRLPGGSMLMIRPWAVAKAQLRGFFMCLWRPRQQVTIMESQSLKGIPWFPLWIRYLYIGLGDGIVLYVHPTVDPKAVQNIINKKGYK